MLDIRSILESVNETNDAETLERTTVALVPGSFKPPHAGHWSMVEEYAKFATRVVVVISTPTAKSARKTKLGTVISPEDAQKIFEIYKAAYHLSNVEIFISSKPSPIFGVIDYMNKTHIHDANIILGASKKDDDWKRWTSTFVTEMIARIEKEPTNLKFLNPETYAVSPLQLDDTFASASYVRANIDDFEAVSKALPEKLSDAQKHAVFAILNKTGEQLSEDGVDTRRTGIQKIPKLTPKQTRELLLAIRNDLISTSGYEMLVSPKSDGSAVRVAWDASDIYIENSHSGLVSDPSQISISSFKDTLIHLKKPQVKARFDKLLSSELPGIKVIGELLSNSELDRDEDGGITFVATTYDSAKLGRVASIVVFDIQKMADGTLTPLSSGKKAEVLDKLITSVSDAELTFIDNKQMDIPITLKSSEFSEQARAALGNLEGATDEQLAMLRDELNAAIVKTCDNMKKPDIIKGDVVEGLVFEIAGKTYAVQSQKWIDRKHDIYQYSEAYDSTIMKFMKDVTGFQQKRSILSRFDSMKDTWQPKYSALLPKFKKELTAAYDNYVAHKNVIPKFVYNINGGFIRSSYAKLMKLTNDIESLRTMLAAKSMVTESGGLPGCSRINQENVKDTMADIYSRLLPKLKLNQNDVASLGSTGKKLPGGTSGDIDLGIDLNAMKKSLGIFNYKEFQAYCNANIKDMVKNYKEVPGLRVVQLSWPIANSDGKQEGQEVQLDLMPVYDLEWIKFGEGSPYESVETWKGACRNQIMMSMAAYRDRKATKTVQIDGKEHPAEYKRYSLTPRDGLFQQTFKCVGKPGKDGTPKLLKNPSKIDQTLVTSDAKKVISIIFKIPVSDVHLDDYTTTMGTWKKFQESDLWQDEKLRTKILTRMLNELNRDHIPHPPEFDDALTDKSGLTDYEAVAETEQSMLCEGGNAIVQKGSDAVAARIKKEDIEETKKDIDANLLKPLGIALDDSHRRTIGSLGKKPDSGDIDMAIQVGEEDGAVEAFIDDVDHRLKTDPRFQIVQDLCAQGYKVAANKGLKEVSVPWPITHNGQRTTEVVQLDLMPTASIDSLAWAKHAPSLEDSKYKGAVRNIFLEKIAAGMKYKMKEINVDYKGKSTPGCEVNRYLLFGNQLKQIHATYAYVTNRKGEMTKKQVSRDDKLITTDPNKIVQILFNNSSLKADDCLTIEQAWKLFETTPWYKNQKQRDQIVADTINELKSRPLDYPPEFDHALSDTSLLKESIVRDVFNASQQSEKSVVDSSTDIKDSLMAKLFK